MMYKLLKDRFGNQAPCVLRVADNAVIPTDESNTDYQEYLKWVAEGNTPLSADE